MSRIYDALLDLEGSRPQPRPSLQPADRPFRVVTVASNKGGVGKTTIALNLAVYLRALREDLPILVLGLDDQSLLERMFALEPGDSWCLCAARWQEAFDAGMAPPVRLTATHERTLEVVELADLKRHALDVS